MTYLLELRTAASKCSNIDYRFMLLGAADEIAVAINQLHDNPTTENMIELNSCWAVAERILKEMPPEGSTDPLSGAPEPAKLSMAA